VDVTVRRQITVISGSSEQLGHPPPPTVAIQPTRLRRPGRESGSRTGSSTETESGERRARFDQTDLIDRAFAVAFGACRTFPRLWTGQSGSSSAELNRQDADEQWPGPVADFIRGARP
jgi:hypothetical protein